MLIGRRDCTSGIVNVEVRQLRHTPLHKVSFSISSRHYLSYSTLPSDYRTSTRWLRAPLPRGGRGSSAPTEALRGGGEWRAKTVSVWAHRHIPSPSLMPMPSLRSCL